MPRISEESHRRSVRLPAYDYAQAGAYFVTICTKNRIAFFADARVRAIAEQCWLEQPKHVDNMKLDEWVVMPNHVHGIVILGRGEDTVAADGRDQCRGVQLNAPTTSRAAGDARSIRHAVISPQSGSLGVIIRTYKAAVTALCRDAGREFAWQRNYYEHIIRDEDDLWRIRDYIRMNPVDWKHDEYFVQLPLAPASEGPPL
jgi:REP element-mobilizing transposase RayT